MNLPLEPVIFTLRGHRVILDKDLADLYGVSTKRLNEQVTRNLDRFPNDFMFQLKYQELRFIRSQNATLEKPRRGEYSKYLPRAFTEHGAVMVASILNSKIAIEASILLVRTFIRLRAIMAEHIELKKQLQEVERKLTKGFAEHEQELQEIRFIISQLEYREEKQKRKIGFARE